MQTQSYRAPARSVLEQFAPQLIEQGIRDRDPVSYSIGDEVFWAETIGVKSKLVTMPS